MRIMLLIMLVGALFLSGCSSCSRDKKENVILPPSQYDEPHKPKQIKFNLRQPVIRQRMNPKLLKKLMKRSAEKDEEQADKLDKKTSDKEGPDSNKK